MKVRITQLVIVGMVMVLFTACMNLGASSLTRYYLLESKSDTIESTLPEGALVGTSLGVGPVAIPEHLNRPHLVSRLNGNQMRVDEFHQWAEPLKTNISRVIEENLFLLTDARHIYSFPKRRAMVVDYQISLDIRRFDADASGNVTLKSVWRIVNPNTHQRLMEKRSRIIQSTGGSDPDDIVGAMSTALAELSHEMARALVGLVTNLPETALPVES